MKRREFISLLGATTAWPLAAPAQQPVMPVVGYLNPSVAPGYLDELRSLRQGLKESGYVEGENVTIELRWAENEPDRLPVLAADLVRRRVGVIIAASAPASVVSWNDAGFLRWSAVRRRGRSRCVPSRQR